MTLPTAHHGSLRRRVTRRVPALLATAVGVAGLGAEPYVQYTAARLLPLGLLAASVAVLTGLAGLPTLGQVAPYAVGGYTAALLARAGVVTGVVQLAAAAATAVVFSALVGVLVVRTRGTVCLMLTLAIGVLTAIAAEQMAVTGGTDGLAGIPAVVPVWGLPAATSDTAIYGYVAVTAGLVLAALLVILRSPAGLLLTGCRSNEARMRACGHRVNAYLWVAYTGAGAIAGIAGALTVTVQRYLSPADVGFDIAALILLAVVIAGPTSVALAAPATAAVFLLRDEFTIAGHGPLILGLGLIAAMYLLPDGLAGATARLRARRWRPAPAGGR